MQRTSRLFPEDWEYLKQMEVDLGHTLKSRNGGSLSLSDFIQEDQLSLNSIMWSAELAYI